MTERATLLFFLLFALFFVPVTASAGEPIQLWHSYRGAEERAIEQIAHDYERAHPGTSVQILAVPFEAYGPKLEAAIPRGHGPDVFIQAHQWLGPLTDQRLVAPIGDALPEADLAAFDPVSVKAVTWEGVRYAIPFASKSVALYVNPLLLPEVPASLEAFAPLLATLPHGVYPLAYRATNAYYHAPVLHAFGGRLVDDAGRYAFYGTDAARSLELVRDLTQRGVLPIEPSAALAKELFASGRAGAVIDGPWLASDLDETAVRYVVRPLPPAVTGGPPMQPLLTVEAVFLSPAGGARPEARAFARALAGPDAAVVRAVVGQQVVARNDTLSDPRVTASLPRDVQDRLQAFAEAAKGAVPMSASIAMQAAWEPANQAIQRVLNADADPRASLDEARRRFDDAMRPPPPPASPAPLLLALGIGLAAVAFLAVRRARDPSFRKELRASLPAYAYVTHAVVVVVALVILPLAAGALTSLFVGSREAPRYVGLANYLAILTARGAPLLSHGSFYLTLLVTLLWTVANVALHLALGVTLGVLLSAPLGRLRPIYRVILILPWAVPSYVTALAWKGMFHRQLGAVNALLLHLGVAPVSWFSHFSTAFTANVATNVWLGFPFMMVVTLGALTSVPRDVLEAAEVDGATRWQRFRLVTLPVIRPVLLPAVVLGAVWTFNMFNVVFLVSGGDPDGTTDILVSEAYRWAFTRDKQYGYAAAYAVLIFLLLAVGSRLFGKRLSPGEEAA